MSPSCSSCGSRMVIIKAGISKRTGKPYSAFWSCPNNRACGGKTIPYFEPDPRSRPKPPLVPQKPDYGPHTASGGASLLLSEVVADILSTVEAIYKKISNIESKLYDEGVIGVNEELEENNERKQ
ncbi:hypothetical protein HY310_01850 [Candidatus Microgenomates bacterium]|nr:hypothetical protein [Candidatus Microgenomates bacterium]